MIRVVTDSTATVPANILREFEITVIPVYVTFGSHTLLDTIELSPTEFYRRLAASTELPTTSQPSVQDFESLYRRLLADDPRATILSIHISNLLSGTITSARQAAAHLPDADIRLFDTQSVSMGHLLMVREAAAMAKRGADIEAILKRLADMRDRTRFYATMNTLEYLAKGGRIGRAARLMGTLLDMKPIITFRDGAVDGYDRQRTRERSIAVLKDLAIKEVKGARGVHLGVAHAVCEDEARRLADELLAVLEPEVFVFAEVGPSVGTYTGPGTLGVCWYVPSNI